MTITPATRRTLLISSLLALATLTVYWPVRHFEFVNYDDTDYVCENSIVQRGLTWDGFRWALTNRDSGHWHPLTWLSLMADATWHGLDAGGFHLTNLFLHTANVVLLFLVLRRLTGDRQSSVVSHQLSVGAEAKERSGVKFSPITGRRSLSPDPLWPSAWVAALFALHPLHVESVAWVTERKDVLSGLFWMLTLGAYGRYAASDQSSVVSDQLQKGTGRETRRSRSTANRSLMPPRRRWYGLTLLCFALGLLAKPMVVTLPFVLLLLDWWPLRRTTAESWWHLAREKIPLFLLVAASCWITLVAGAVSRTPGEQLALGARLANAVVTAATYLHQMIWPVGLACFYPHPGQWPPSTVVLASAVVAGLTVVAVRARSRIPALLVGWCWYLGALVPVIGLVQVGGQAHADRYTYLPLIGVWVAVAWASASWAEQRPAVKPALAAGGAAAVLACAVLTSRHLPVWRDSRSLFQHALAVTRHNWVAHNGLGVTLANRGQLADALQQFTAAVHAKPNFADAYANRGNVRLQLGQPAGALADYQAALRLQPQSPATLNNLAWLQATAADPALRDGAAAVRLAERAVAMTGRRLPEYLDTLAAAYAEAGRWPEAVATAKQAVVLARAGNQTALAAEIAARLESYRAGQAWQPGRL